MNIFSNFEHVDFFSESEKRYSFFFTSIFGTKIGIQYRYKILLNFANCDHLPSIVTSLEFLYSHVELTFRVPHAAQGNI